MESDYTKTKREMCDYAIDLRKKDKWIKVLAHGGSLYGKVKDIGENMLYLNPSLVWKESKDQSGFKIEEGIPTAVLFSVIHGFQPMTKESIDNLIIQEEVKTTGFNAE